MNQTRQKLTLPSGATCVVRKLSAADFALHTGDVPVFNNGVATPERPGEPDIKAIVQGVHYMRIALLCCCSPITLPDGRRLRIADKELDQLKDGEITIGEMDDADAQAVFNSVAELSGVMRKEAVNGQAAKPFPAEQESTSDTGHNGQSLSLPAESALSVTG